jgi:peptidase M23-like protein
MSRLRTAVLYVLPVLVVHVFLPVALLMRLWDAGSQGRLNWLAALTVAGTYAAFLYLAGAWSWFGGVVRHFVPAALLVTLWTSYLRGNPDATPESFPSLAFLLNLGMGAVFAVFTLLAWRARNAPDSGLDLRFPLRGGTFHVAQGGASQIMNHHFAHPSQRYALDIVKLYRSGWRALGLYPAQPDRYAIWGAEVVSPCEAVVKEIVDGLPDQAPPRRDSGNPAGNHVVLECEGVTVLLAHLQQGSICVRRGDPVQPGQMLGRIGNSGNTTEPHLHVHAERNGKGIPLRFDGRFLVRNDVVRVRVGVTAGVPAGRLSERALHPEVPMVGDSAMHSTVGIASRRNG